ncbi:MAG: universal stress protein [Thermoplasmata archaeon]|nr:universal stress protein [Thermoplasmata archaeon]
MKRILVGYDGSQGSERAVNKALSIIDEGGEIVLLAVVPCREGKGFLDSNAHELAKEKAEGLIEDRISLIARNDITVRGIVREGDVVQEIIEVAKKLDCDLILLGKGGHSEIGSLQIGSVAEKVIMSSHKPVMIVR